MSAIPLIPGDDRLAAFPVSRPQIYEFYEMSRSLIWNVKEIDFSRDRNDFVNKLTDDERHYIERNIAFFAALDRLVNDNISERFLKDFPIYEVSLVYNFQVVIEDTHSITYATQLDTLITDHGKRKELLDGVQSIPTIARMADWIVKTKSSDAKVGERLVRMMCVEGLFFIGAFAAIYWIGDRGYLPGLVQSNELIGRDESLHVEFSAMLYELLKDAEKISNERIIEIFKDAMVVADEFIDEALPVRLIGINSDSMKKHLRYHCNTVLRLLDVEPAYPGVEDPFTFTKKLEIQNRTNFFERRVTEYKTASGDISWAPAQDF